MIASVNARPADGPPTRARSICTSIGNSYCTNVWTTMPRHAVTRHASSACARLRPRTPALRRRRPRPLERLGHAVADAGRRARTSPGRCASSRRLTSSVPPRAAVDRDDLVAGLEDPGCAGDAAAPVTTPRISVMTTSGGRGGAPRSRGARARPWSRRPATAPSAGVEREVLRVGQATDDVLRSSITLSESSQLNSSSTRSGRSRCTCTVRNSDGRRRAGRSARPRS